MQLTKQIFVALAAALFMVSAMPGHAQQSGIGSLLSGKTVPLTLTLKDLNSDWRRMGPHEADGSTAGRILRDTEYAGEERDFYYSKGDKTTVGNDIYLVAYLVAGTKGNLSATPSIDLLPTPLTPDTPLKLVLLNIKDASVLSDIQPFNLQETIDRRARAIAAISKWYADSYRVPAYNFPPKPNRMPHGSHRMMGSMPANSEYQNFSSARLAKIGKALHAYLKHHQDTFPSMKTAAAARSALRRYEKSREVYIQLDKAVPYQPNAFLSKKKLASILNPWATAAYYETIPDPCGCRMVLFADGHIHEVMPNDWGDIKKESHIH